MQPDTPRLQELRRRIQSDQAPFVFAQLAEEYCRVGSYQEAIDSCREALDRHPNYLSARVILGRAYVAVGSLEEAGREFETVLRSAPDNLAATRGLADVCERTGKLDAALACFQRAMGLAPRDASIQEAIDRISRSLGLPKTPPAAAVAAVAPAASPLSAPKVDLDGLLTTLGLPDREAPSSVQRLLSRPTAPATPPPIFDDSPPASADDPFALLEERLRSRTQNPGRVADVNVAPATAPEPPSITAEDATATSDNVLSELEAWLAALRSDRDERLNRHYRG